MIWICIQCMPWNNFISVQYLCNYYLIYSVADIYDRKFDQINKEAHMCVNITSLERLYCYVIEKRKANILVYIYIYIASPTKSKVKYTRFPIPNLFWSNIVNDVTFKM